MARKVMLETRAGQALYTLFGISCHLKDYRLSFHINNALDLQLVKLDDFREFSLYLSRDEDYFNIYYLIGNRAPEAILVPDLKQTDFLLLVEGPFKKAQKDKLLAGIRSIQNVLTAFEVKFETIRNYGVLLTDLELHMMEIQKESKVKYSPPKE
jgi:hypothetical protein